MTKGELFTIFFTFESDLGTQSVPCEVAYTGLKVTMGDVTFYKLINQKNNNPYHLTADFIKNAQPEYVTEDHVAL